MQILDVVFVYRMREEREIRWHSRRHSHGEGEFELHYFIRGTARFRNHRTTFRVLPGSLCLTQPLKEHAIILPEGAGPLSYYAVLLKAEAGEEEVRRLLGREISSERLYRVGTNYRFFFEEIREKGLSGGRALEQSAVHQLISFLYLLSGEEEFHFSDSRNAHIEKALKIMQDSIARELDLEELSRRLGLNKSYFIRLFRKKMKTTPMKYFTRLRVEAAGAMLTGTSLPLAAIAQDLHFYSEFHFSRVFKQYTGSSPSAYRGRYRKAPGIRRGPEADPAGPAGARRPERERSPEQPGPAGGGRRPEQDSPNGDFPVG